MKILHISTRYTRGGAEKNLRASIEWERASGYEVHVAVGAESDPNDLPTDVPIYRISNLHRAPHPLRDLRGYVELKVLIRKGHFDVVHTHESKAGVLGRLASRGHARVVVHTVHMASFGPGYPRLASFGYCLTERICARFTNVFVAVGEELRQSYQTAGIGREKPFFVVRSPIAVEEYFKVRFLTLNERRAKRATFGLDPSLPVVLAASALEKRKRHELLLDRLSPLLRASEAQLLIVGTGPERERLTNRAASLGVRHNVHFAGHVDMQRAFAAADLLVHCSRVEGVSQVVIEALAAGLPVVATEVEGLCEAGPTAIKIVERDGTGLAEAVNQVLASPRQRPLELGQLSQWTAPCVAAQIGSFHALLNDLSRGAKTQTIPTEA